VAANAEAKTAEQAVKVVAAPAAVQNDTAETEAVASCQVKNETRLASREGYC